MEYKRRVAYYPALQEGDDAKFKGEFTFTIKQSHDKSDTIRQTRELYLIKRSKVNVEELVRRLQQQQMVHDTLRGNRNFNGYQQHQTHLPSNQQPSIPTNFPMKMNNTNDILQLKPLPNLFNQYDRNHSPQNQQQTLQQPMPQSNQQQGSSTYGKHIDRNKQHVVHILRVVDPQKRSTIREFILSDENAYRIQTENDLTVRDTQNFADFILDTINQINSGKYGIQIQKFASCEHEELIVTEPGQQKSYSLLKFPMITLNEIDAMTQLAQQIRTYESEVERYESQKNELLNKNQKLTDECQHLKREGDGFEKQKATDFDAIKNKHQQEIMRINKEHSVQMEKLKAKYETELIEKKKKYANDIKQMTKALEQSKNEVENYRSSKNALKQDLSIANEKIENLNVTLDERKEELISLREKNKKIESKYHANEIKLENLSKRNNDLELKLTRVSTQCESLEDKLKHTDKHEKSQEALLLNQNKQISKLKKEIEGQAKDLSKANHKIKESIKRIQRYKSNQKLLQDITRKLDANLNEKKKEIATLNKNIKDETEKNSKLTSELKDSKREIETLTKSSNELTDKVKHLTNLNMAFVSGKNSQKSYDISINSSKILQNQTRQKANLSHFAKPSQHQSSVLSNKSGMTGISLLPPPAARTKEELFADAISSSIISNKSGLSQSNLPPASRQSSLKSKTNVDNLSNSSKSIASFDESDKENFSHIEAIKYRDVNEQAFD